MNRRKMCWDVNSYEDEAPVTVYDCHGQVSQLPGRAIPGWSNISYERVEINFGNMFLNTNGWFMVEIQDVWIMILKAGDSSWPGLFQLISLWEALQKMKFFPWNPKNMKFQLWDTPVFSPNKRMFPKTLVLSAKGHTPFKASLWRIQALSIG